MTQSNQSLDLSLLALFTWLFSSFVAGQDGDYQTAHLRLTTLQKMQQEGRYVNPSEVNRLTSVVQAQASASGNIQRVSEELKNNVVQDEDGIVETLKEKAISFVKENAVDFIKGEIKNRKDELVEKIGKAKNAREVAQYLEKYTYEKNAPLSKPALAKLYNNLYHEQKWIRQNIDRKISAQEKSLGQLNKLSDGIKKVEELKEKAERLKKEAEDKIEEWKRSGLGEAGNKKFEALRAKYDKYSQYYEQVTEWKEYYDDLKGRADAAADEAGPDLPEAARNGLRNMVYMGEALEKFADKTDVPGLSDMLKFYADATKVSVVAARNANKFKTQSGEINVANQLLGKYNDLLENDLDATSATMTEFGEATGIRLINCQDGKRGLYLVGDDFKLLNRTPFTDEQIELLKGVYSNFEAIRGSGDKSLSAAELASVLKNMADGEEVVIRDKSYGKLKTDYKGRKVLRDMEMDVRVAIKSRMAGELASKFYESNPSQTSGVDRDEFIRQMKYMILDWSKWKPGQFQEAEKEIKKLMLDGFKRGKSFAEITKLVKGFSRIPKGVVTVEDLERFLNQNEGLGLDQSVIDEMLAIFEDRKKAQLRQLASIVKKLKSTEVTLRSNPAAPIEWSPALKDSTVRVSVDHDNLRPVLQSMRDVLRRLTGTTPSLSLSYQWVGPGGKRTATVWPQRPNVSYPVTSIDPIRVTVRRTVQVTAPGAEDRVQALLGPVATNGQIDVDFKAIEFPTDIAGKWTGNLKITGWNLKNDKDGFLALILNKLKGVPISTAFRFRPSTETSGKVTAIFTLPDEDEPQVSKQVTSYRYVNGQIEFKFQQGRQWASFRGTPVATKDGWTFQGTAVGSAFDEEGGTGRVNGKWTATNPLAK